MTSRHPRKAALTGDVSLRTSVFERSETSYSTSVSAPFVRRRHPPDGSVRPIGAVALHGTFRWGRGIHVLWISKRRPRIIHPGSIEPPEASDAACVLPLWFCGLLHLRHSLQAVLRACTRWARREGG